MSHASSSIARIALVGLVVGLAAPARAEDKQAGRAS